MKTSETLSLVRLIQFTIPTAKEFPANVLEQFPIDNDTIDTMEQMRENAMHDKQKKRFGRIIIPLGIVLYAWLVVKVVIPLGPILTLVPFIIAGLVGITFLTSGTTSKLTEWIAGPRIRISNDSQIQVRYLRCVLESAVRACRHNDVACIEDVIGHLKVRLFEMEKRQALRLRQGSPLDLDNGRVIDGYKNALIYLLGHEKYWKEIEEPLAQQRTDLCTLRECKGEH